MLLNHRFLIRSQLLADSEVYHCEEEAKELRRLPSSDIGDSNPGFADDKVRDDPCWRVVIVT